MIPLPGNRPPPSAVEAEQAILSAVLADPTLLCELAGDLAPDAFFSPQNARVYTACLTLHAADRAVDLVTVADALRASGDFEAVGGIRALTDLLGGYADGDLAQHVEMVRARAEMRASIAAAVAFLSEAYGPELADSPGEARERLRSRLDALDLAPSRDTVTYGEAIAEVAADLRHRHDHGLQAPGLPTGYADLDFRLGGFREGEITILAARPGMGKTALAHNILGADALADVGCLLVTPEVSARNVATNAIARHGGIDSLFLRRGVPPAAAVVKADEAAAALRDRPLWIMDRPEPSVQQIAAALRRLQRRRPIELLVIDHLGRLALPGPPSKPNHERVRDNIRQIGTLAKRAGVHVLLLQQLSRVCESRGISTTKPNHRPILSDLAESGTSEADAETVVFLYRDEYYMRERCPDDRRGVIEFIVAKARFGNPGTTEMVFIGETGQIAPAARGRWDDSAERYP